jgi:fatty acid desaturase
VVLVPFWTVRTWFGLAAWLVPGVRNTYGRVFLQDKSGKDLTHSAEVMTCGREELGQIGFQVPMLVAFWLAPVPFLLAYGIPVTLSGLLAAWRLLVEHRYTPTQDRRIETILATTNDHQIGRWTRWLLAPRRIGYHVVHHIHPAVGLRHLPALREWYQANHPDYPEPT